MGKAVRVVSAPKLSSYKLAVKVKNEKWHEELLTTWIKDTCVGTVSFRVIRFETSRGDYIEHDITCWFTKRQDAMLFKLEYML